MQLWEKFLDLWQNICPCLHLSLERRLDGVVVLKALVSAVGCRCFAVGRVRHRQRRISAANHRRHHRHHRIRRHRVAPAVLAAPR